MRRHLFFTGALAATLIAAACSSGGSSTATKSGSPTTTSQPSPSPAVIADLAPTGQLRVATAGPGFLAKGSPPTGVGVDLASAISKRLGVQVTTTAYDEPPALVAAAQSPGWDLALMPLVPDLANKVDYSGPVILVQHTLLVRAGSNIQSMSDADQPGVRIAAEGSSGHTAVLAGQLHHAELVKVDGEAAGIAMLKAGQVDAFANGRFRMPAALAEVPGAHVITDNFFTGRLALAVAKGHSAGLAYITEIVEELKASGAVQRAIDAAHLEGVEVAPAGSGTTTTTSVN